MKYRKTGKPNARTFEAVQFTGDNHAEVNAVIKPFVLENNKNLYQSFIGHWLFITKQKVGVMIDAKFNEKYEPVPEQPQLKLEVGKSYVARNGEIFKIFKEDNPPSIYPFFGKSSIRRLWFCPDGVSVFGSSSLISEHTPVAWYENTELLNKGVLCWVSDDDLDKKIIDMISEYSNNYTPYPFLGSRYRWKNVIPLTDAEIDGLKRGL